MIPSASWFEANWLNCVQTISIVLGLLFTGLSYRRDIRSRAISNLLTLKAEHREMWNLIHEKTELARTLQPEIDLIAKPMTEAEEVFLRQVIIHFAVGWQLIKDGAPIDFDAFRRDVRQTFSLPLPRAAWKRAKEFQNPRFVSFIEKAIVS